MRLIACVLMLAGMAAGQVATSGTTAGTLTITQELTPIPTITCPKGYHVTPGFSYDVRDQTWECEKEYSVQKTTTLTPLVTPKLGTVSDPPRSVPAVHHSSISVDNWRDCPSDHFIASGTATIGRAKYSCVPVKEWTCSDPDRALLVSQNGKKAACLLVESE